MHTLLEHSADVNDTGASEKQTLIDLVASTDHRWVRDWRYTVCLFIVAECYENYTNKSGITALKIAVFESHPTKLALSCPESSLEWREK